METRNLSKELRIGNLIEYNDGSEECKVLGIHEYGIDVEFPEEITYIEYEAFSPIPLTEEWLLKFGFKPSKNIIPIYDLGLISIYLESDSYSEGRVYFNSWCIMKKKPKYLHQLQNLYFALTGEELEINLTQE